VRVVVEMLVLNSSQVLTAVEGRDVMLSGLVLLNMMVLQSVDM